VGLAGRRLITTSPEMLADRRPVAELVRRGVRLALRVTPGGLKPGRR
jgi:hypothetical protein